MINLSDYYSKELLTAQLLYSYVSDYEIFNNYIPNFQVGKVRLSPLRKEHRPSFIVFYAKDKDILLYHDFIGETGDAIKFVGRLYSLSYYEAMSKIAYDFGVDKYFFCKLPKDIKILPAVRIERGNRKNFIREKKTIEVRICKYEDRDIKFWKQYGISLSTLQRYKVLPISFFKINEYTFIADKYAYVFVEVKDGKITYKIYQPHSIMYKWITSHDHSVHQGYTQLPKEGNLLIITKSLKDVMSIYEATNIPAVGIQSESVMIKDSIMDEYKNRFKHVIGFFDNDDQGEICAEKYHERYNIPNIFMPVEVSKDFSDSVKNIGPKKSTYLLHKLIKNCIKNDNN